MATEREMFEKSFQRPKDYFKLTEAHQWQIDLNLGILDWRGEDLSEDDMKRFKEHYMTRRKKQTGNGLIVLLIVINLVLFTALVTAALTKRSIQNDCNDFGSMKVENTIYVCTKK